MRIVLDRFGLCSNTWEELFLDATAMFQALAWLGMCSGIGSVTYIFGAAASAAALGRFGVLPGLMRTASLSARLGGCSIGAIAVALAT